MTTEKRTIPATKGTAKATLMPSQVADWEKAGWTVSMPKVAKTKKAAD